MNTSQTAKDNCKDDTLDVVLGVFKDLTMSLIKTKWRTVKRVVFSNNEEGKKKFLN